MRCKEHPKYKGVRKPRSTPKFPEGCKRCWEIYQGFKTEADWWLDYEREHGFLKGLVKENK